jgi:hypothetical protein
VSQGLVDLGTLGFIRFFYFSRGQLVGIEVRSPSCFEESIHVVDLVLERLQLESETSRHYYPIIVKDDIR